MYCLKLFEIELFICIKMDLALNNLQTLICYKRKPNHCIWIWPSWDGRVKSNIKANTVNKSSPLCKTKQSWVNNKKQTCHKQSCTLPVTYYFKNFRRFTVEALTQPQTHNVLISASVHFNSGYFQIPSWNNVHFILNRWIRNEQPLIDINFRSSRNDRRWKFYINRYFNL